MRSELQEFLAASLSDPSASWNGAGLREMARLRVPDRVFGASADMLRGDVHRQWADWFVGTICDVERFAARGARYPQIYQEVSSYVGARMGELRPAEGVELARHVARLVHGEVRRRSEARARVPLPLPTRRRLVDLASGRPHCWVCGWRFAPPQLSAFLGESAAPAELPALVDVLKPIGLSARHLRIEVDHVVARSRGGSDGLQNLRLCCGWCNVHKSDRSSIYEVPGEARPSGTGGERRGLPQPFWVVRLLVLQAEEEGGRSPLLGELTVAPRNPRGALNPANLEVVTYADDPLGPDRFQSREVVARMWGRTT